VSDYAARPLTYDDFIIEEMTVDGITSVRDIENWSGPFFQIKPDGPDSGLCAGEFIGSRRITETELDAWMTGQMPW
jgi:hypothetical protein